MRFSAFFVWVTEGFQRASFVKKACVLPLWSGVGEPPRRLWPQAIYQTHFGTEVSEDSCIINSKKPLLVISGRGFATY